MGTGYATGGVVNGSTFGQPSECDKQLVDVRPAVADTRIELVLEGETDLAVELVAYGPKSAEYGPGYVRLDINGEGATTEPEAFEQLAGALMQIARQARVLAEGTQP